MRSFLLVPVAASLAAAQIIATCARDNCLRAVIASNANPGPSKASADCSSFFRATVTPATITSTATSFTTLTAAPVTQTAQITTTTTASQFTTTTFTPGLTPTITVVPRALDAAQIAARQQTVSPASVPTYASACSGTARYASACSCIGVTRTVSTVGAPRTTTTSISTVYVTPTIFQTQTQTQITSTTVVSTVTAPPPDCTFYLQAQGSDFNNEYAIIAPDNQGYGESIQSFTSDASIASLFTLSGTTLLHNGNRANTDADDAQPLFFNAAGTFNGASTLVCAKVGMTLGCTGFNGASQFQYCTNVQVLGNAVVLGRTVGSGCQGLSFNYVCA